MRDQQLPMIFTFTMTTNTSSKDSHLIMWAFILSKPSFGHGQLNAILPRHMNHGTVVVWPLWLLCFSGVACEYYDGPLHNVHEASSWRRLSSMENNVSEKL
jgi:hypothetical protein